MSQLSLSGRIVEQLELNENFSSQRKRFLAAGADSQLIDAAFQQFKQLKDKGLLSLEQKDIDRYSTLEELQQVLSSLSTVKTKTQQKKERKVAGAELVYEDDSWKVYHITTEKAAKLYGKGTKWCISAEENNQFNDYDMNTIYIAVKTQTGAKRAVLVKVDGDTVVYDERDDVVNMTSDMPKSVFKVRELPRPDPSTADQMQLVKYAKHVIKGRWPEAEPAIMTDPDAAGLYANDVIKGRWPEGEWAIAQDPGWATLYAMSVLKRRWPEAERYLVHGGDHAVVYAEKVIKGRWPELEAVIVSEGAVAADYAMSVLKRRWPEAEPAIKKCRFHGVEYAKQFLPGGKWPEERA